MLQRKSFVALSPNRWQLKFAIRANPVLNAQKSLCCTRIHRDIFWLGDLTMIIPWFSFRRTLLKLFFERKDLRLFKYCGGKTICNTPQHRLRMQWTGNPAAPFGAKKQELSESAEYSKHCRASNAIEIKEKVLETKSAFHFSNILSGLQNSYNVYTADVQWHSTVLQKQIRVR